MSTWDDAAALLQARIEAHEPEFGLSRLRVGEHAFWVGHSAAQVGQAVKVRVLARDVSVTLSAARDSSILNILPARIDEIRPDGADSVTLRLSLAPDASLLARLTRRSCEQLQLRVGMKVFAQVKGAALLGA